MWKCNILCVCRRCLGNGRNHHLGAIWLCDICSHDCALWLGKKRCLRALARTSAHRDWNYLGARDRRGKNQPVAQLRLSSVWLREFSSIPATALCENSARTEYDLCVPTSLNFDWAHERVRRKKQAWDGKWPWWEICLLFLAFNQYIRQLLPPSPTWRPVFLFFVCLRNSTCRAFDAVNYLL